MPPALLGPMIIGGGMMGAAALGGGGGGGDMSQQSTLTPGQQQLLQQMTGTLGQQWGQGLTPYGGQRVAGVSPLQQQGFDFMGGLGGMFGPAQDITQQALGQYSPAQGQRAQQMGMGALGQMMQPFDPQRITEAFKPVQQFAMQGFQDEFVPWAAEKYGPALGAKSSGAFGRELSRGAERLQLGLSAQMAPYQMQGFQNQQNRMLQSIPMSQQMAMGQGNMLNQALSGAGQYGPQIASSMMGVGGVQRGITGEQLGGQQQQWQEAQPYNNPWLQNYLGTALGTQGVENVYQQGGPGISAMLGPAMQGAFGSQGFWDWANPQAGAGAQGAFSSPW